MKSLQLLLAPSMQRAEFTLRLSVIATLTCYLVMYYQTPEPALTAYLTFFLNKPDRVSSILSQIIMTLLMAIVIALVILTATWVMDSPFCRVITMIGFSVGLLFLSSASKLKPIAGSLSLITGYSLTLLGSAPSGEAAVRGLLYAWLFVAIPAGASLLVNLLMGPAPAGLTINKIRKRLQTVLMFLNQPDDINRESIQELLFEGNAQIEKWLKVSLMEHSLQTTESEKIHRLAKISFDILALVSRFRPGILDLDFRRSLAQIINQLLLQCDWHAPPLKISGLPKIEEHSDNIEQGEIAKALRACLKRYNQPANQTNKSKSKEAHRAFFHPDAFTNPEHVYFALKTTGAAMACYFIYTLLDWPGIHTCFITCYIVSQGTAGESVAKLRLRLAGCLLGAGLGFGAMIEIVPMMTSIESLLVIVFLGTLFSGWIAAGSPRISYAGYQVAFAFYLCILQGASPEFDLTVARDRVLGVLLGNFVAYLFITGFWPMSIGARLDQTLVEFYGLLRKHYGHGTAEAMNTCGPVFFPMANQLSSHLELARLEPIGIRPEPGQLALRENLLNSGLRLHEDLWLSSETVSDETRTNLERLSRSISDRLHQKSDMKNKPASPADSENHPPELDEINKLVAQLHPLCRA